MARRIESHVVAGPAGALEAILEEPDDRPPIFAALVCHPHPLYGGTMHNKVVHRLARGLRRAGAVVLRINFRGVGRSQGSHAHGEGEIDDARAALEWLAARYPQLSTQLAGFSFGARVVTRLGCAEPVARILAVGFPTRGTNTTYLESCPCGKSVHTEHKRRVRTKSRIGTIICAVFGAQAVALGPCPKPLFRRRSGPTGRSCCQAG